MANLLMAHFNLLACLGFFSSPGMEQMHCKWQRVHKSDQLTHLMAFYFSKLREDSQFMLEILYVHSAVCANPPSLH